MGVADLTPGALAPATREIVPWMDELVRGLEAYLSVGGFPRSVDFHIRGADDALFRDLRPHLRAHQKVYLMDPVLSRMTRHLQPGLDMGILSEQQLGIALLRSMERETPGTLLDYDAVLQHRTPTRKEIDFVGPGFGGVAIESKYVFGNRWRRAIPTLKASRRHGIVATRDDLDVRDPRCWRYRPGRSRGCWGDEGIQQLMGLAWRMVSRDDGLR